MRGVLDCDFKESKKRLIELARDKEDVHPTSGFQNFQDY